MPQDAESVPFPLPSKDPSVDPIGFVRCPQIHAFEAPRQPGIAPNEGRIELLPGKHFDVAAADLEGFERIWVIFQFRHQHWRPKVLPPRLDRKVGTFATRSPYRPNPLGLSAVELVRVEGLVLHIRGFDMLDGTPVLDLKPYLPYCDSHPESQLGWKPTEKEAEYAVVMSPLAQEQARWIEAQSSLDLQHVARVQLSERPLETERKRVQLGADGGHTFACRTWRLSFRIEADGVFVDQIHTGYSAADLEAGTSDRYNDKDAHRAFVEIYGRPTGAAD